MTGAGAWLLLGTAVLGATVWVAPGGDDSRDGASPAAAVRTVGEALRRVSAGGRAEAGEIVLAEGVYRLAGPLRVGAGLSGRRDRPLLVRAAEGAHPVLSGGERIVGWREVDHRRHLWEAPLPEALAGRRFRQLYVEGVRAWRARGRAPAGLVSLTNGYEAPDDRLARWRHPAELELVFAGGDRLWSRAAAGAARPAELRVPVRRCEGRQLILPGGPPPGGALPDELENAPELLGRPGEWYADAAAGLIQYVPRAGEDLTQADVEAPRLESLVAVEGDAGQPAHDIVFQGLTFAYAGERPATVAHARRIRWEAVTFAHLGGPALRIANGCEEVSARGCVFTDLSGEGVVVGPAAQRNEPTAAVRDCAVEESLFTDVGAEFHGAAAVRAGATERLRIVHNQIDHVPGSALWLGEAGAAARDSLVADNLISDSLLRLAGGGAILIEGEAGGGLAQGAKVIGNVVRDQWGSGHALDFGRGARFVTFSGNAVFQTNSDACGPRRDPTQIASDNWWQQNDVDRGNRLISGLDEVPAAVLSRAGFGPEMRARERERARAPVAPAPPEDVAVWAGDRFALIAWSPPCFEGGGPVRTYTVRASTGEAITISEAHFRSEGFARLDGLANGIERTFSVEAGNRFGRSAPSLPSAAVTGGPRTIHPPSPPHLLSVVRQGGLASLRFEPPDNDGGGPVLAYALTINPGKRRIVFSGRTELVLRAGRSACEVVDGLAEDSRYWFSLAAANPAGEGQPMTVEK